MSSCDCSTCGAPLTIPVSDYPGNKRPICSTCNVSEMETYIEWCDNSADEWDPYEGHSPWYEYDWSDNVMY